MSGSGETYPARHGGHRRMGPPESCDRCHGRGFYPEWDEANDCEGCERFCDCPCGDLRWAADHNPTQDGEALVEAAKVRAAERAKESR